MLNTGYSFFQQNDGLIQRFKCYLPRVLIWIALSMPMQLLYAEDTAIPASGVAAEIDQLLAAKQHPYLKHANFTNRAEDLDNLYKLSNRQLLWLGNGRSEKNIADALALLSHAADEGLNSASYDVDILQQKLQPSLALSPEAFKELALYDTALSISVLRYLHDLHYGRVNPQGMSFNLKLRQKKLLDLPVLIKDSLAQGSVSQLPAAAEPNLKQYRRLKQALADYRVLAGKIISPGLLVSQSIKPGNAFAQGQVLKDFLIAVGDMPADKPETKANIYTNDIAAGVKQFQLRHGLNGDGVLGAGTAEAINVPLKDRAIQIELAMERLRWLPEPNAGRSVIVNIPSFQLWAFDDVDEFNADIPNMRVVVGKAMETQTPILMAKMSFIDFMPYWNVPNKITKDEILPKLLKNSHYLDKENMELVGSFGNEVRPVPFGSDSIMKIKQGILKVRQRPGKKNALGKVKFIFPNKDDVYLHDTPANSLFSKSRRDFSHGCVRVANPDKLAEFALKDQWTKEAIKKAMNTPKTQRVILKKPIPVLFFYVTAIFDKNDKLTFYSDIYGHDAALLEALKNPEDLSDQAIFAPPPAPPVPALQPSAPAGELPAEVSANPGAADAVKAPEPAAENLDSSSPAGVPKKPVENAIPAAIKTSG